MNLVLLLILGLMTSSSVNCIHFQLYDTKEKCVFEDLPRHEVVLANTNLMDDVTNLTINVLDPKGNELITQNLAFGKGKLSFTTREEGVFKICVKAAAGEWTKERKKIRYSIRIFSGENSNYEDLANQEHLSQLQILIMKLNDHAQDFIKMQEMNRGQEAVQVEQNQSVNERVILTTIFQTIIILLSGLFQIFSLRKYFIQKKIC